ncbi:tyrosine-type recombinase/integrase [Microcoleus sp. herbarium2]|uniref:tyrosine-type recombinase/integrase n=1 Tax=Microcoleus sp. herbarium2 TaxID=3055433 RepID=UPI002FCEC9D9
MKICRNGQATPLTPQTYQEISNHLRLEKHKLFLGIAWYTGERPEAILSVDVGHIYENPAQRQPRDTIIYPGASRKDNKTREVPTHWALKLMLAAYQPPEKGFLFPSFYDNEQHLSRQAMDKVFRLAVQKAGLEHRGFSLYSARRGFITHLSEKGLSIKTIQSLTGHKSLSSLVQYIEVSEEQRRNAIAIF